MGRVFIIAEAGDNHNGDIRLAYKLIDKAVDAGADCVKFQTFITEDIITRTAEKAEYQKRNTGNEENQFEMVKKLELSFEDFRNLNEYCKKKNILFLSTPFDLKSVAFLENLSIPFWKIPSGEITNLPYLRAIARTGKKIIMSTGMAQLEEIRAAVEVLKKEGAGEIKLLHCSTDYPARMEEVNLLAMKELQEVFGCEVGYSDHTKGIEIPIAAVALGASIIEKHFTLDHNLDGPDHKASLEPNELKNMIHAIRNIEKALGDGHKRPGVAESRNIVIARKSIVARRKILKGEFLTEENLAAKRPGTGISPMEWDLVTGTRAVKDFEEDEMIVR